MFSVLNLQELFLRRLALALLLLVALAAGFVSVIHRLESNPHPIDLIIPPILAFTHLALFIFLYLDQGSVRKILLLSMGLVLLSTCIVAWFFVWQATLSAEDTLVELLPPIHVILLPLILSMMILLRPYVVLRIAVVVWIIIAAPILVYLIYHPQELMAPRGIDLLVTLGPVMIAAMVLIPFHQGIEQKFFSMRDEQSKISALAERDPLTNLYNRRVADTFLAKLKTALKTSIGVILFDIDHFKAINDNHGHSVGDQVLCEISRRCTKRLRNDDLFIRWGGEEFMVLVWGAGGEAITRIAEDLRQAIHDQPIEPAGIVTASFGVTQMRAEDSVSELLQRVDTALYSAKNNGRNKVISQ